jgi:hypothetical protein
MRGDRMYNIRKVLKNSGIICSITVIVSMIFIGCSFGDGEKMEKKINLVSDYNLDLDIVDKIIIETTKYSRRPCRHIVIEDKKKINYIVSGLKNITATGGIDTMCDYDVSFYNGDNCLVMLGLKINLDYPISSFIRYSSERFVLDFRINSEYYNFFINILNEKPSE